MDKFNCLPCFLFISFSRRRTRFLVSFGSGSKCSRRSIFDVAIIKFSLAKNNAFAEISVPLEVSGNARFYNCSSRSIFN